MKFLLIFFLFVNICFSENLKIYGNTNYFQKQSESLVTIINLEYKIKIFEPRHKKWIICLTSIANPELDHFQNEIRVNVFTTIGINF